MFLVSSCSCLCATYWSQVISQEWRYSWSSADRGCSNYIWVIKIVLPTEVSYIRGLTVVLFATIVFIFLGLKSEYSQITKLNNITIDVFADSLPSLTNTNTLYCVLNGQYISWQLITKQVILMLLTCMVWTLEVPWYFERDFASYFK